MMMGPRNALLVATVLLCALFLSTSGQQIFPSPVVNGEAGQNVSIACDPFVPGRPTSNELQIYIPQGGYNTFEGTADALARLTRDDSGGVVTNYTFGPLTAQDDGTIFRCLSSSTASGNTTINVVFEPIIIPVTQTFVAEENVMFVVNVNVSANPQPTSYFWERDGRRLSSSSRISLSLTSIQFMPALSEDAGMYTLSVTNAVGTSTFNFNLTVAFGPEFGSVRTDVFNCSDISADGSLICASYPDVNGKLNCTPVGYPLPTVTVVLEGVTDSSNVIISGGEISITAVQPGNAGNYTCTATSSRGTLIGLTQFFVGGLPGPVNIDIISRTNDDITVRLTYNNADNGVPATSFYVDVIRLDTSDLVASTPYPVTSDVTYNIPIARLRALEDRMYHVSARAENLHGNSTALSEVFTIRGGATELYASSLLCIILSLMAAVFY